MSRLYCKDMPRYECLVEASKRFPDLDPMAADLYMRLLHVADRLHRVDEAELAAHGFSPARFAVLMLLWDPGLAYDGEVPLPQVELADRAGVSRATMTGLVDGLERDGFVVRRQHPEDRRVTLVALTAAARRQLERMMPAYCRHVSGVLAGLGPRERQALRRSLVRIQEGIEARGAKPAAVNTSET